MLEIEARLAIASILTTGRTLEALMELLVFPCEQSLRASGRCFGLIAAGQRSKWVLPLGTPKRAELRSGEPTDAGVPKEPWSEAKLYTYKPHLFPTLTLRASDWVQRYWRLKKTRPEQSGTRLLACKPEILVAEIIRLIRGRRSTFRTEPRHASRTLRALERYLCASLTHQPGGDLASAARITDNTLHISETASHYGQTLLHDPDADGDDFEERRQRLSIVGDFEVDGQRLGGGQTPSTAELKIIIARLQHDIELAVRDSDEFHQTYSRYTAFMVCFGLAHRGEKNQLLPSSEGIDRETGFLAIHDTLRTDQETHTRMVWVPPVIRQQISYYESYLHRRAEDFPEQLRTYMAKAFSTCGLPFVVLTEGDGQIIGTRQIYDQIRATAAGNCSLKLNAGRHWLRSAMLGRCSEETINAFLGHWYLGREPWTYGSTFDPLRYRADLQGCLPGLLADLGFRAIPASGLTNDN